MSVVEAARLKRLDSGRTTYRSGGLPSTSGSEAIPGKARLRPAFPSALAALPLSLSRAVALERFGFGRQGTPPHKRTPFAPSRPDREKSEHLGDDESVGLFYGSPFGSW
ncbi:hypothetical protein MTO96_049199 [Rhipicephalus appendiculatus]